MTPATSKTYSGLVASMSWRTLLTERSSVLGECFKMCFKHLSWTLRISWKNRFINISSGLSRSPSCKPTLLTTALYQVSTNMCLIFMCYIVLFMLTCYISKYIALYFLHIPQAKLPKCPFRIREPQHHDDRLELQTSNGARGVSAGCASSKHGMFDTCAKYRSCMRCIYCNKYIK